ncbi:MAG: hypothetical protein II025_05405 [Ruminococcus sp.]|nr:hypothetical protein [Ruminococcus sp.]
MPRNSIYCNICGAKLEDDEPVTAEKAEAPAAVQTVEEAADAAAEAVTETAE